MQKSRIEWTEKVWNPVTGCTKISSGCKNCYAEGMAKRFWGKRKFTDVQCHPNRLQQPLAWKKPSRIFVNSMSDIFHEKVPFKFIEEVFEVMRQCKQHTFLVLTKRLRRGMLFLDKTLRSDTFKYWPFPNVWIGVTAENQKTADERIPLLLRIPAAVRFISIEPMLEPINLQYSCFNGADTFGRMEGIGWIVLGGESGPRARPMRLEWASSIRDQCRHAKIPFFMKQINKKIPIPHDLMIREFPKI